MSKAITGESRATFRRGLCAGEGLTLPGAFSCPAQPRLDRPGPRTRPVAPATSTLKRPSTVDRARSAKKLAEAELAAARSTFSPRTPVGGGQRRTTGDGVYPANRTIRQRTPTA